LKFDLLKFELNKSRNLKEKKRMPSQTKGQKRREQRQRAKQRDAGFESEYQRIKSIANQVAPNDPEKFGEAFGDNSPNSIDFQIFKHKKLIQGVEEALEEVSVGITKCCLVGLLNPDRKDECERVFKVGEARQNQLLSQNKHSNLMIELLNSMKGVINCKSEKNLYRVVKCANDVKENINSVCECLRTCVEYGIHSEGDYVSLSKLFMNEWKLWDVMARYHSGDISAIYDLRALA
jgi:hypothetical protein